MGTMAIYTKSLFHSNQFHSRQWLCHTHTNSISPSLFLSFNRNANCAHTKSISLSFICFRMFCCICFSCCTPSLLKWEIERQRIFFLASATGESGLPLSIYRESTLSRYTLYIQLCAFNTIVNWLVSKHIDTDMLYRFSKLSWCACKHTGDRARSK